MQLRQNLPDQLFGNIHNKNADYFFIVLRVAQHSGYGKDFFDPYIAISLLIHSGPHHPPARFHHSCVPWILLNIVQLV
ncbi:hypothetical protein D3C75_858040 [compost metagenome]